MNDWLDATCHALMRLENAFRKINEMQKKSMFSVDEWLKALGKYASEREEVFAEACREYPNKRHVYLAYHAKRDRARVKNAKKIESWYNNENTEIDC